MQFNKVIPEKEHPIKNLIRKKTGSTKITKGTKGTKKINRKNRVMGFFVIFVSFVDDSFGGFIIGTYLSIVVSTLY